VRRTEAVSLTVCERVDVEKLIFDPRDEIAALRLARRGGASVYGSILALGVDRCAPTMLQSIENVPVSQ